MKLVIQIPCYQEAETLEATIADLPREVAGFDTVEILVIDDGSDDGTYEIAERIGADHIVRHPRNLGLARAFATGLETALKLDADVIVNTDGDNQYQGDSIKDLVAPIVDGQADIVVGDRQVESVAHFSSARKILQRLGSMVVRWASGTQVTDATSGFRAMTRDAAMHMVIYSDYTYTLETIIQAGKKGLTVLAVPVGTNERLRESRLIASVPQYVWKSAVTILRIFLMYESLRVFLAVGVLLLGLGGIISIRFLYLFLIGEGQGHIQSLILASIMLVFGFQAILLALLADVIAKNRFLAEEINYRAKKIHYG